MKKPLQPPLIRIIDDDAQALEAVDFMLKCEGYSTVAYSSAAEFLVDDIPSRPVYRLHKLIIEYRRSSIMREYADIKETLETRKDRSAWDKGVTIYALELLEEYAERAAYEGRQAANTAEFKEWLKNGASDWDQYSWGGSSLIYNSDIAERLCCPSELKKTRNGERRPNSREEWLDTQARALRQAAGRLTRAAF